MERYSTQILNSLTRALKKMNEEKNICEQKNNYILAMFYLNWGSNLSLKQKLKLKFY